MNYKIHGILQARILEWVAFPFSRGSSQPGIQPRSPALQVDSLQIFTIGLLYLNCVLANCVLYPLAKTINSLKSEHVSDLFYTSSIYHIACHLGVGESLESVNE